MFETCKIEDVMTPRALKVRPGHYIDTNDMTSNEYHLWVRHGKDFIAVSIEGNSCPARACVGSCKKLKLNASQRQTVPKLLALLNHGQS